MTKKQAYSSGFLLQCASMGLPAEQANVLLKKALLGQILGTATNLGVEAGKGALNLAGTSVEGAGGLGSAVAKENIDSELALPNLEAAQKLMVAEHYRRALQALQAARASRQV